MGFYHFDEKVHLKQKKKMEENRTQWKYRIQRVRMKFYAYLPLASRLSDSGSDLVVEVKTTGLDLPFELAA